ncbi:hypothetical protein AZI86_14125 [Bdellovibrio bacteriovorus]|uniref:Solute-binding protein family 3/N-terminal domain-containing protein n=1 Tax=Bdellovibrio bacteriovorus TaxID=959 RepID=A0A150WKD1_BDEBC|nr:hypothetical protein AZI86_14125 [Bdellovibrio bacteriovorus]
MGFFLVLYEAQARTAVANSVYPAKIELVTWTIPLMVESKDKGLFVELVREIGKRNKKDIGVSVQSAGQALMSFSSSKVHGYFPAHIMSLSKNMIATTPFYTKNDYVFFRKDKRLTSIKDLEGKKVGLTFRYFYDPEILNNKKIRVEYADDDFINMKKLGDGLIDAFVVEERSGIKALQESGFTNIEFDKASKLSSKSIHFAFENSAQGAALRDLFDKTLNEMKKDGSLDRLFATKN